MKCKLALVLSIAALAVPVAAQEIVLFQGQNFSGPQFAANESVADLNRIGFNDRASSVRVRRGAWQLCSESYYRGSCVTLQPGDYPSLGAMGLNNAVSSLREIGWSGGGGGGGGGSVGGSIVLYEYPGMTGRSYTLSGPLANFDGTGFNDRASSAVVNSGTWQLCSDANFASNCEVFRPGQHGDLGAVTGQVSSARPMSQGGEGGGGGGSPGWSGGNWGGSSRVVLYEGQNFQGRAFTVNSDVLANLNGTGMNDRASSMRVERGYWMFCTDANFLGECRTFGPGDYASLSWFANRISSGRRISNDYPYNAPPAWR
jgi:hypothetical protein